MPLARDCPSPLASVLFDSTGHIYDVSECMHASSVLQGGDPIQLSDVLPTDTTHLVLQLLKSLADNHAGCIKKAHISILDNSQTGDIYFWPTDSDPVDAERKFLACIKPDNPQGKRLFQTHLASAFPQAMDASSTEEAHQFGLVAAAGLLLWLCSRDDQHSLLLKPTHLDQLFEFLQPNKDCSELITCSWRDAIQIQSNAGIFSKEKTLLLREKGNPDSHWLLSTNLIRLAGGFTAQTCHLQTSSENNQQHQLSILLKIIDRQQILLSRVGHDVRDPLNAIFGISQILLKETPPGPRQNRLQITLDMARRQVLDVLMATAQQSTASALAEQKNESSSVLACLNAAIAICCNQSFKCEVRVEAGTSDAFVNSKPSVLTEILLNLIHNAMKHSPDDAIVDIGTKAHHARRAVEVTIRNFMRCTPGQACTCADHGAEAGVNELAHTNDGKGWGQGLRISKWLLAQMSGQLEHGMGPEGAYVATLTLPMWQREGLQ